MNEENDSVICRHHTSSTHWVSTESPFYSYGPAHTANLGQRSKQACSHMHTLLLAASEHLARCCNPTERAPGAKPGGTHVELHGTPRSCLMDVEVLAQSVQQGLGVLFVPHQVWDGGRCCPKRLNRYHP